MKAYNELWWDREFVEKRIQEQKDYIQNLLGNWSFDTPSNFFAGEFVMKIESARSVLKRFERQLENIKKLL